MKKHKRKLILAGGLIVIIFLLGLLFYYLLDQNKMSMIREKVEFQTLNLLSLQTRSALLSSLEEDGGSCLAMRTSIEQSVEELGESLNLLKHYKSKSLFFNKREYEKILKHYALDNIRYWLIMREAKEKCNFSRVDILYFHSENNCEICPKQGQALTRIREDFEGLVLVFPINLDNSNIEPTIEILRSRYDVNKLPTIIIDGEKYTEVMDYDELKKDICFRLQNLNLSQCKID